MLREATVSNFPGSRLAREGSRKTARVYPGGIHPRWHQRWPGHLPDNPEKFNRWAEKDEERKRFRRAVAKRKREELQAERAAQGCRRYRGEEKVRVRFHVSRKLCAFAELAPTGVLLHQINLTQEAAEAGCSVQAMREEINYWCRCHVIEKVDARGGRGRGLVIRMLDAKQLLARRSSKLATSPSIPLSSQSFKKALNGPSAEKEAAINKKPAEITHQSVGAACNRTVEVYKKNPADPKVVRGFMHVTRRCCLLRGLGKGSQTIVAAAMAQIKLIGKATKRSHAAYSIMSWVREAPPQELEGLARKGNYPQLKKFMERAAEGMPPLRLRRPTSSSKEGSHDRENRRLVPALAELSANEHSALAVGAFVRPDRKRGWLPMSGLPISDKAG